ncbi:tyrosinase central domain-containing protein [Favolaschia claudopus]|uniref:Tyrosinase central domain-containing protein n=1 Tax=Favolaschia claudopus TaxID=2862362 RepID=A0AAV9ZNP3_9AGAR
MAGAPVFPPEIEREVFECAALSLCGTIPNLLLVAHRVHQWIEPILYRIVRINTSNIDMVHSLFTAMSSKPPQFFQNSVRHLSIEQTYPTTTAARNELLSLCTGLTTFGCSNSLVNSSLLPILAQLRVEKLSICLTELFYPNPVDPTHSVFCALTHLDLFVGHGEESTLPDVSLFPSLTHLCVDTEVARDAALKILERCPRLQLLLIQWPIHDQEWYVSSQEPCESDVRFVIGVYDNYWGEWEAEAKGLSEFWREAAEFVMRKRRGEIPSTRYWIHDTQS